jgi:hypothetical protein
MDQMHLLDVFPLGGLFLATLSIVSLSVGW